MTKTSQFVTVVSIDFFGATECFLTEKRLLRFRCLLNKALVVRLRRLAKGSPSGFSQQKFCDAGVLNPPMNVLQATSFCKRFPRTPAIDLSSICLGRLKRQATDLLPRVVAPTSGFRARSGDRVR